MCTSPTIRGGRPNDRTDPPPVDFRLGDCLEVMEDIPDHSVDMVLCDLPYGTTQNKWDSVIPLDRLWDQYKRVIKTGAPVVLFGQMPFSAVLYASNPSWFRYEWIWVKAHPLGFLSANRAPMRQHENIAVFCERGTPYYPQMSVRYGNMPHACHGPTDNYGNHDYYDDPKKHPQTIGHSYPSDILRYSIDKDPVHPTQKPVALLEYLIKTYTEPGQIVLDNTMGSGSTGVASVRTGRGFIGIEQDFDYYKTARERVEQARFVEKSMKRLDDWL